MLMSDRPLILKLKAVNHQTPQKINEQCALINLSKLVV